MMDFICRILRIISFGLLCREKGPTITIVTLLIYPRIESAISFGETAQLDGDKYFVSSPWTVDVDKVNQAIEYAQNWLAEALGTMIPWKPVRTVGSQRSLSEWRSAGIQLIKREAELLDQPWTEDYVYLAFVRGMGGYAGGIGYQDGNAGYAMVGDICLEAICEYPEPTAGSVLLEQPPWAPNAFSSLGQTGAFIHEALHGLGLPHPDEWQDGHQPGDDETIMGHWWKMPSFTGTKGLTKQEIDKVLLKPPTTG